MENTEVLNKVKQFESALKTLLIAKFGKVLPENKIILLNSQSFVDTDMIKQCYGDNEKLRGVVLRTLLDNVIDVKCKKDLEVNGNIETVNYGDYLQDSLVEYYARIISQEKGFTIDSTQDIDKQIMLIQTLKEKLGDDFDKLVLNNDANTLLAIAGSQEFIEEADKDAIKRHIELMNQADKVDKKANDTIQKVQDSFENKEQINIVYLKGKQYVKYVDKNDVVHLVETEGSKNVSKLFKEKIQQVGPGKLINPEDFFNELTKVAPEENMVTTEDKNPTLQTHQETDMISFVRSNSNYVDLAKKGKVTHSNDGSIHVLENTNDVVVTESNSGIVSSDIISHNSTGIDNNFKQETAQVEKENDDIILSPEKYEELCNNFKSGKNLTLEELRALKKYEEMYMSEYGMSPAENTFNQTKKGEGPVLSMYGNNKYKYAGFTNKYLIIYIIIMTICIGIIVGAVIFKLTN